MQIFINVVLALTVVLASFVVTPAAIAADTIRINGTGSGLVLMKPLMAAFGKENRGVTFEMEKSLGSSASIKAVAGNALDLAISGRPLKPAESAAGLVQQEYGKIPFAVLTNRQVRVSSLTIKEVADLFAGTTTKWPGGELVRLVLRPNEDTDTKLQRAMSPEMNQAVSTAQARKDMLVRITDNEAFDAVKRTAGAVGIMALSLALSEPDTVNVVKLDGVQPTIANLASGKYLHSKDIVLVTRKDAPAAVAKFVKFLYSKKGRALAAKSGLLVTGVK